MPTEKSLRSPDRSLKALDRLNITLGDVRDVFEPYLAIFLATERHWNPAQVGLAIAITNIAGILTQTPIGALVDTSKHKRLLIAIASFTIAISYLTIIITQAFPVVIAAQAGIGVAAVTIIPAVSAISLGLVGQDRFNQRIGRNEAFNRTGNAITAVVAGVLAQFAGLTWIFYLLVLLCIATIILIFRVQSRDIDNTAARSDYTNSNGQKQSQSRTTVKDLLSDRPLLIFSVSVFLFYAANAALLPLIGQQLTGGQSNLPSALLSGCIAVAQFTTIPIAAWAGKAADRWGRKPLLLLAFAATTLRAFLYGLNASPWFIIGIQTLDGIASGIFAVLLVVVVADLTKGTGRFNLAQGGIYTTIGVGAALSNFAIGFLVKVAGFAVGFFTLSAIAAMGMIWLWFAMPETKESQ